MSSPAPKFVFFGTPEIAVTILEQLKQAGLVPSLIVAAPDKPQGRHFTITPPATKVWAEAHGIPVYQPASLRKDTAAVIAELSAAAERASITQWDLFVVAAYGLIIPQAILDLPKHQTLNVHPSLLPALRGPAPIEGAILADMRETGVTIMRLDAEMDHGPIVAQGKLTAADLPVWPIPAPELEKIMGRVGGALLAKTIPAWIAGNVNETEQDHARATFVKMIEKAHGEIRLTDDPYQNYLKYCAYAGWPRTFFFQEVPAHGEQPSKKIRVVIARAHFDATATDKNNFVIDEVIPEGKKAMAYADFMRGLR